MGIFHKTKEEEKDACHPVILNPNSALVENRLGNSGLSDTKALEDGDGGIHQ